MTRRPDFPSRREGGFTLVELIVTITIIGILAAVAIPIFLNQQRSARDASVVSDVQNTTVSVSRWVLENSHTAVASTTAFTSAGGKIVQSDQNVIDVTASGTGTYTVCGYTPKGAKYNSTTSAYLYSSTTGHGVASTAGCPGDGVGGGGGSTGGTTGGSTGGTTGGSTGGGTTGGTTGGGTTPGGGSTATSTPTPTPTATADWINCASENQTCSFTGTHEVRYGLPGHYATTKTFTGGVACNNGVFGDPYYGYVKVCDYLP